MNIDELSNFFEAQFLHLSSHTHTHTLYFNLHPNTDFRKVPAISAVPLCNLDSGFWFLCLNWEKIG